MSQPRTLYPVAATAGSRTPVYTGKVWYAVAYEIVRGLCTIFLAPPTISAEFEAFPDNGMNKSQQVTLWGYTFATFLNGVTATIWQNNPAQLSISFPVTEADAPLTGDSGYVAIAPTATYRTVRIQADKGNTTHSIYVGDLNVSASRYTAVLTLTGQVAVEFAGDNIPAERIFIDTDSTGAEVQVTLL